jgi:hypothetical protein
MPASARAVQSRFVRHPGAQAVPAQYSPVGQLSFEGKHCTHWSLVVSHQGAAPWHCELRRHSTQALALQTSPAGHGCVDEQPGTQALALQTVPAAQSLVVRQPTHARLVALQRGVGAAQSVSSRQPTHALVATSQTVPVGQLLAASQPWAQALATQRWSAAQSAEVRQATQDVWALHFCPVGQSASVPHSTHALPRHT